MAKRATSPVERPDPRVAAEQAAAEILAKYAERMRWGDRKDDMAWLTDLRADIVAAIVGDVAEAMDVPASRLIDEQ